MFMNRFYYIILLFLLNVSLAYGDLVLWTKTLPATSEYLVRLGQDGTVTIVDQTSGAERVYWYDRSGMTERIEGNIVTVASSTSRERPLGIETLFARASACADGGRRAFQGQLRAAARGRVSRVLRFGPGRGLPRVVGATAQVNGAGSVGLGLRHRPSGK